MASGTGKGGKSYQDRILAGDVRNLALAEIRKILLKPKHKLYGPVIIRLAGSVLPRLNEHTGADGEALHITFDQALNASNTPSETA